MGQVEKVIICRFILFAYDYAGRRVRKTTYGGWNGSTYSATVVADTKFLYVGWNLVAEYDVISSFVLQRSYTWGLDVAGTLGATGGVGALLQFTDHPSGKTYWTAYDGNGNVVSLVNAATGSLAAAYEYDPYGNSLRTEVLDATVADAPFRYSTKYTDKETGLVYYGHRYYDPKAAGSSTEPADNRSGFAKRRQCFL